MQSNLTGTLATELLFLRNLESLNIYNNEIKGSMPVEYLRMTNLRLLYLGENLLTSLPLSSTSDPTSSSSFSSSRRTKVAPLELLSAHSNPLKQELPVRRHEAFRKLQKLDLAYTQLRGGLDSLPEGIEEMRLCHNNLTGRALGVSHLVKLLYLDVSHNQLLDIDLISSPLQVVEIGFNQLRRELPARLPANISIFNAPNNIMTGNVTEFLIHAQTDFPNIKTIDLRMNKLTGQLPETGWTGLKKLEALGLSDNNLHGSIPVEFYTALQNTMISYVVKCSLFLLSLECCDSVLPHQFRRSHLFLNTAFTPTPSVSM
jgi:Leucine-rich repeat (LRR) protein